MSETADERFQRERREDYEWWRERTTMHALTEWDAVLADEKVILPKDGSYYIIANNIDEMKEFLYRIDDIERWASVRIIKDRYADSWDGDEELDEPIRTIENPKSLHFNQYFALDEQLQVTVDEEPHTVYAVEFDENFLEDLTFPCLMQHSGDGGADRLGDFEINHCQVLSLTGVSPRVGPVKIHLRWI